MANKDKLRPSNGSKKNSNHADAGLNKLGNGAAKPSKEAKKNSNDANVGLNKLGNEAAKPSKEAKKNSNDASAGLKKLGNGVEKLSKEAKKNSNGADAVLNKLGNGAANPDGKIDLDKAGVDLQNVGNNANQFFTSIGNKMRAFFVGGWTRNEYIGFWVTFGILIGAVIVAGLVVACPRDLNKAFDTAANNIQIFDTEAFAKAYTDLKKFGNDMEKAVDNTGIDIKKIGGDMQESMDSTSMDLEKFNSDVIGAFETCNEDIDILGKNVEEVVNKDCVGKFFWNVFDKATEEIQKLGNMLKK